MDITVHIKKANTLHAVQSQLLHRHDTHRHTTILLPGTTL